MFKLSDLLHRNLLAVVVDLLMLVALQAPEDAKYQVSKNNIGSR